MAGGGIVITGTQVETAAIATAAGVAAVHTLHMAAGDPPEFRGADSVRHHNSQFKRIGDELGLTHDQRRQLHDMIIWHRPCLGGPDDQRGAE